jgi:hypothetical protein
MERVEFITHRGARILVMDLAGLTSGDMLPHLERTRKLVSAEPLSTVRTLIDVTNTRIDLQSVQALKNLAADDKPFIKASAVVGINGPLGVLLDTVEKFSGRSFKRFGTRNEALDYLCRH